MSDNAKNGIIDLTEIVEMGTPPEQASASSIPASPAGTVDFESELEDLFTTTDFSEFTDSDPVEKLNDAPVVEAQTDTPSSEPAIEDLLADIAPQAVPAQQSVQQEAPSFESDLDALLDSADEKDSSVGFDADFEDLLNEFTDSPAPAKPSGYQPDFDEDLSSMSLSAAEPEPVVKESTPQPQAVAEEPVHATEANIADVDTADLDDLFADLDMELGTAEKAPEPQAAADDILADFDFEPAPEAAKAPTAPAAPQADDDLLAELGMEFDLGDLDAPSAPVTNEQPATEANIADVSGSDVDDLFADLDAELGEAPKAPVESAPPSAPAPEPQRPPSSSSGQDISLDDPFDVDDILNEFSDDSSQPAPAPQDDLDFSDLDALLKVDDEPEHTSRTDLTAADGTTLDSEDVEMDDIGFLLSELDDAGEEQPFAEPEPVQQPEVAVEAEPAVPEAPAEEIFEPSAPVEAMKQEPSAPIDGSMFDADIDALLDDLEMASVEPSAPLSSEPEAPVQPEAPVEAVAEPVNTAQEIADVLEEPLVDSPEMASEPATLSMEPHEDSVEQSVEDDVDIDALLESDPLDLIEEEQTVAPTPTHVVEDDLAAELDALLDDDAADVSPQMESQETSGELPVEETPESPLGASTEFESILDELDSLLDEQQAMEPVMDAASEESADDLLDTPVEDVLADDQELASSLDVDALEQPDVSLEPAFEEVAEPASEQELLAEPTSLEDDLDSTLDRILGEEPLAPEIMNEVADPSIEQPVQPADFTHDDIDALLTGSEGTESVSEPFEDVSFEEPPMEPITEVLDSEAPQPAVEGFEEPSIEAPAFEENVSEHASEVDFGADVPVDSELLPSPEQGFDAVAEEFPIEEAPVAPEAFVEPEVEPESALESPIEDVMSAMEDDIPMEDIAQEAMAELEAMPEIQPEFDTAVEPDAAVDVEGMHADDSSILDMEDINQNAAPVPPNASIEDLMRESAVSAPEFSDSSMEMLDTTPAVNSAVPQNDSFDEPPVPAMTPEEFAELTERIYYLESTLQNVVAMQESFTPQPAAVEKEVLVEAIDDAFNIDGPLMARVLSAVEVRTETLIESMGTRIEGQIKNSIEQAAAKSAAQVIREELQALLAEDFS